MKHELYAKSGVTLFGVIQRQVSKFIIQAMLHAFLHANLVILPLAVYISRFNHHVLQSRNTQTY